MNVPRRVVKPRPDPKETARPPRPKQESCPIRERGAFTVELPLPPDVLSPNKRGHWGAKARATKAYREACAWAFKAAMPKWWGPCAAVIEVEYRAHRGCGGYHAFDVQNAMAAIKSGVDGAIDAGVIPSDGRRWLQWQGFDLVTTKKELAGRKVGVSVVVMVA
jgi:hypothetical protein